MTANVIAMDRSSAVTMAKEEYVDAIKLWCERRDAGDILTREEIAALGRIDRVDAQRKAIILSLVHYYRKHERADVAPGVAVVITLLSDNDKGCADISQPVLARLFGRSLSSIGEAIRRLKEDGIIISGRGRYPATYPVIPRAVTTGYNHLTWLIAGACEAAQPANLPVPSGDCQSTGPARGLAQSTGRSQLLKKVNPPVEGNSIHRGDRCLLHKNNSTTLDNAREREEKSITPRMVAASIAGVLSAALPTPMAAAPVEQPAIVQSISLSDQLLDAGGRGLANPAACPGLLVLSEPSRWLANGCDLEKDILPVIRARAAKAPHGSIRSWGYFTQAVADAKAAREAPMPEGKKPAQSQGKTWHDEQEAALKYLFRK